MHKIHGSELCINKNVFLDSLKDKMEVFTHPMSTNRSTKCDFAWKAHGTCCSYDSMAKYIIRDRKRIQNAEQANYHYFNRLIYSVYKFTKTLLKLKNQKRSKSSFGRVAIKLITISTQFHALIVSKQFNSSSQACWKKMTDIRGGSMCSTCSGNSNQHFIGDKAVISQKVCSYTMSSCALYTKFVQQQMGYLDDIISQMNRVRISELNTEIIGMNNLKLYTYHVLEDELHDLIDEYLGGRKTKQGDEERKVIESALCYKLISLNQTPYIVRIMQKIEKMTKIMERIVNTLEIKVLLESGESGEYHILQHMSKEFDWKGSVKSKLGGGSKPSLKKEGRKLSESNQSNYEEEPQATNFFSGDVIVKNEDGSITIHNNEQTAVYGGALFPSPLQIIRPEELIGGFP